MGDEAAVEAAVDSCIEDGILADILRKERARVRNILISALTEEEITRLREYEREMDKKEARDGGLAEGEARMADLISCLLNQNRIDDLQRASTDPEFRKRILDEMGPMPERAEK